MSSKLIFIQTFDKILFKHHFLRIMSLGNGPKMTHFSCLIFDFISLSDVISSIGPKTSDAVTYTYKKTGQKVMNILYHNFQTA